MTRSSTVRAVNALTARWAAVLPAGGTAFTTAGVWSLLALLADGATGAVRKELADAIGIPADNAADQARDLLATINAMPGVHSALGLWTHEALPIGPTWLAALPERVHGQLTGDAVSDQARLDAWAATCTDGQIPSMPVTVEKDTQLVLAGALTVRTDWIRPFTPGGLEAEAGPWRGKNLAGLFRVTALLNRVGVTQTPVGPVTVLDVLGTQGVDVHLFLGPEEASPGARADGSGTDPRQPEVSSARRSTPLWHSRTRAGGRTCSQPRRRTGAAGGDGALHHHRPPRSTRGP
ncbi:serpin family protein [Kitasatospora sp. NPDC057542]|uniref:serpin family protein n=1 Tax=Kitasatospora sp. NPDC057542 TaxID=3346162 RepID=UPI0036C1B5E7